MVTRVLTYWILGEFFLRDALSTPCPQRGEESHRPAKQFAKAQTENGSDQRRNRQAVFGITAANSTKIAKQNPSLYSVLFGH